MSPARSASASASASRGSGGGRGAVTALVLVGVVLAMLLLVRAQPKAQPFDPRSNANNGARTAVLVLQSVGATVNITATPPDPHADERVLVISDRLNDGQRAKLLEFVSAGGVAVVADPASTLHGGTGLAGGAVKTDPPPDLAAPGSRGDALSEADVLTGDCTVAALGDLRGIMTPGGILFPTAATTPQCFGDGTHAFVIVRHVGAGLVVGLGDNRLLTNQYLRYADNAGLLTALVAPTSGATVRIMLGTSAPPVAADVGTGDEKLADLVRPGIWMALTQLALAFIVFCIARSVRPGRAVREPRPTPIAGNELVLATGNLMQRAHHHQRASWLIRGEFYRQLCSHYRTPKSIPIDDLAALVYRRTGVPAADIADALGAEATDSASLLRLAARLDGLRAITIIDKPSRIPESV